MKMKNGLIIDEYGSKFYYQNDLLHREDGAAVEWAGGDKSYYLNGKLHREDGAAVEYADGSKFWYFNDKLHREDGAAIEYASGSKFWFLNGELHREDGAAIEGSDGDKEWWINGKKYSEEEFNELKQKNMKQEFEIPEGCKKVIIEQIGNKVIATFEPKGKKRVEKGDQYWCMDTYFRAHPTCETGSKWDDQLFNCGNYYRTPDDPELLARIEMNKKFNLCRPENNE